MKNKQLVILSVILMFSVCILPVHVRAQYESTAEASSLWVVSTTNYTALSDITRETNTTFSVAVLFLNPQQQNYTVFEVTVASASNPAQEQLVIKPKYYPTLTENIHCVSVNFSIPVLGTWILKAYIREDVVTDLPFINCTLTVHIIPKIVTTTTTTSTTTQTLAHT